jgi:hypothetical protein
VVSGHVGHARRLVFGGRHLDAGFALLHFSAVFGEQQLAGLSLIIECVEEVRAREGGAPQPAVVRIAVAKPEKMWGELDGVRRNTDKDDFTHHLT